MSFVLWSTNYFLNRLMSKLKPRTFSKATQMANTFAAKVKEMENVDEKLETFKNGMHDVIREIMGVAFEKADLLELIGNNPKFQPLQYYDPMAIFRSDMDSLQIGQVLSAIANIQNKVDKLVDNGPKSDELIPRLEKVIRLSVIDTKTGDKI